MSIGAVAIVWTVCSASPGPDTVTVWGSAVTLVTDRPGAGAPARVGMTGSSFVIVPVRTGSVTWTNDGSTTTLCTSCPLASSRWIGTELSSCCWRRAVSTVTTAWRTSWTCSEAPLIVTRSGTVRAAPSVMPAGGVPIRLTSTGSRFSVIWSRTTSASGGVRSTTRTSPAGVATSIRTRCSPGPSPCRSREASSTSGVSGATADRDPWSRTCTRFGAWTTTSVGLRSRTCTSRVMMRSTTGFLSVAT